MRSLLGVSVVALAGGAGLVAFSLLQGGASVALLVIFPVVTGSSLTFLAGVILLFVGFFSMPFGLADRWEDDEPPTPSTTPALASRQVAGGGFVLIGPVPILFGSWKGISSRARWALALVGAIVLIAAFVGFLLLIR